MHTTSDRAVCWALIVNVCDTRHIEDMSFVCFYSSIISYTSIFGICVITYALDSIVIIFQKTFISMK